ncbi:hypothetical protein BDZ89DRAFT_1136469 [Hymenopellis radicata]|nr:hypothetical protein BDZ89DRAFT_1136469 [Hymenopellis radicata]
MPFSFEDAWLCCDGASSCPCPNHLGPDWHLPLSFPDTIDSHPSLLHVANGNECPTSDDEDVINRSIPILQSEIQTTEDASQRLMQLRTALHLELGKVEVEIGRLREHHGMLSHALDRRSRIKAPIRRLPSEILTDILWITILSPYLYGHTVTNRPEEDVELEVFELVCKRWRRVVLESPTLWSQIRLTAQASDFRTGNSRGAWSLIRRINRSAHAELDVEIAYDDERPLPRWL